MKSLSFSRIWGRSALLLATLGLLSGCKAPLFGSKKQEEVYVAGAPGQRGPAYTPAPGGAWNPSMNVPRGGVGNSVSYSRINISQPIVAMTFDDGPHPSNTPRLLDMLRQRNIKATFYVVGTNAQRYPEILRRMVAEGHEIGNHTLNHAYINKLSNDGIRRELTASHQAIVSATGIAPRTMRPPYGAITTAQKQWIRSEFGYPSILWAVDPEDWKRPGSSVVANRILSQTRPGAIILAHDIHAPTIDAMPAALDGLLAKGYRFVTVTQLIALENTSG